MQIAAPELLDLSKEPAAVLESYGVNEEPTRPFAVNCLLARRMVERGVRFVMLTHGNWDHTGRLGGEFGRTPMAQMSRPDEEPGRDHHPNCFSMRLPEAVLKAGKQSQNPMSLYVFERSGGPDRTRICDLYRVKVAL
jgi:Protein of unknown function (DUF1501)